MESKFGFPSLPTLGCLQQETDYLELCPVIANGKTHLEYNTVSLREDHTYLKMKQMGFFEKKNGNAIAVMLFILCIACKMPEGFQTSCNY